MGHYMKGRKPLV